MAGFFVSVLLLMGLGQTISLLKKKDWDGMVMCIYILVVLAGGVMRSFTINNYFPENFSETLQVFGILIAVFYLTIKKIVKVLHVSHERETLKQELSAVPTIHIL